MNTIFILAQAAGQGGQSSGNPMSFIITVVLFIIIFYFLLIRPQRKQQKELKARQDALQNGDKVITAGGIFGIVREVKDSHIRLEIAPNVVIKVVKSHVVQWVRKDGSPEK